MKIVPVLFCMLLLSSCSSFLYSPSLSVTRDPVKKGDYIFAAGAGPMPETRPHTLRPVSAGYYVTLGYGFSSRISLHLSGWGSLQTHLFMGARSGYAGHFRVIVRQNERSRFELIPRAALVMHKNLVNGFGGALTGMYVRELSPIWNFYAGVGPALGYQDFYSRMAGFDPDGSALIAHAGLGARIYKSFSFVLEVNPLYSFNYRDHVNTLILPGTLSLVWHLKEKE